MTKIAYKYNGNKLVTVGGKMAQQDIGPDSNGWYRPHDWLPISHLVTDGEEKAVALYAVWDAAGIANGYNNYCALLCRGAYTVDWGDGTVDNVADNVQAEHTYVYANMPASSYCSRGYRQAIITITPQAGKHLTQLDFGRKHASIIYGVSTTNFIDVRVSGTNLGECKFYYSVAVYNKLLEHLYIYQSTNTLTDCNSSLYNCTVLQSLELQNLNFINTIYINSLLSGCVLLRKLSLKLNSPINTRLDTLLLGCSNIEYIDFTGTITSNVTRFESVFSGLSKLQSIILSSFDMSSALSIDFMFYNTEMLHGVDLSHTTLAAVTSNGSIFYHPYSLTECRLPQIGRTFSVASAKLDAANLNLLFTDLRNLNGSISTSTRTTGNYGTGYAVGDLIQINGGNNDARIKVLTLSGSAVATYQLMVAGTGYTVAGALTTTAITGGGSGLKIDVTALVATQTITVTGNPGAATCNPAIATAKNWIVVT